MNENDKISLLLRHADREDIPYSSFGNEVPLNEKGKQNAQCFGEKLAGMKINKIFTSPVKRCVQTAELITQGYGTPIQIIETSALGAPGLHISDEKSAGEFFLQHGFDEMYKRFTTGSDIPGIPPVDEINKRITNFIGGSTTESGITIFITHDILIALYHFSINRKVYTKDNWINYLTGLTFVNGRIYER